MHTSNRVEGPTNSQIKTLDGQSYPAALPLGKDPEGEGFGDLGADLDVLENCRRR
jgi:hypothetical protein